MNIIQNAKPSKAGADILSILRQAVANALEKKKKLGQYAVVWDGRRSVKLLPEGIEQNPPVQLSL